MPWMLFKAPLRRLTKRPIQTSPSSVKTSGRAVVAKEKGIVAT